MQTEAVQFLNGLVLQEEAKKAVEQRIRDEKSTRRALAREDQRRSEAGLNDDAPAEPKLKPKAQSKPKPVAASPASAAGRGKSTSPKPPAKAPGQQPKQQQAKQQKQQKGQQQPNKKRSSFTNFDM